MMELTMDQMERTNGGFGLLDHLAGFAVGLAGGAGAGFVAGMVGGPVGAVTGLIIGASVGGTVGGAMGRENLEKINKSPARSYGWKACGNSPFRGLAGMI